MPKEYINYPRSFETESGEEMPAGSQVTLHWDGNYGTIQLSIDIDVETFLGIADSVRDGTFFAEKAGRVPIFTEALGRSDLQRLIKHARRARDSAFGADE